MKLKATGGQWVQPVTLFGSIREIQNRWSASDQVNSCKVSPKIGCFPWGKHPTLAQRGRKLTFSNSDDDDDKDGLVHPGL